jgi:hypothetical protein
MNRIPMTAVLVSLCVLTGFSVLAQEGNEAKPSPSDEILGLMEESRFSEALRTAAKLAEVHPEDVQVRFLNGVVLMSTLQYKEAVREFQVVIRLDPKNADATANLGLVYDLMGEEQNAEKYLKRALELDPDNPDTQRDYREVLVRKRIRAGELLAVPEGGASRAIQDFLEMMVGGSLPEAFDKHVDQTVLSRILRKAGGGTGLSGSERREFYQGMKQGWSSKILQGGGKYVGFEVQPAGETTPRPGGIQRILTYVLIEKVTTQADVDQMKRFVDSPELSTYISPDIRAVIMGLEPKDRAAMFDRQVGLHQNQLLPVHFDMKETTDGKWRIQDALLGHSDLVQISIVDAMDKLAAFADVSGSGTDFGLGRSSYSSGGGISRFIPIIIGIVVLISFVIRRFAAKN